ncbi:hypothetical protein GW750_00965 [bacterium]|nr:hypothetical protein [bacterium]
MRRYAIHAGTPTTTTIFIKNLSFSNICNKENLIVVHKCPETSQALFDRAFRAFVSGLSDPWSSKSNEYVANGNNNVLDKIISPNIPNTICIKILFIISMINNHVIQDKCHPEKVIKDKIQLITTTLK